VETLRTEPVGHPKTAPAILTSPARTEEINMASRKLPGKLRLTTESDPEVIGESESRTRRFKISSSEVARDGHTLATPGWEIRNYLKNPVVLAAHDSKRIESVIGRTVGLPTVGDDLFADIEFAPADVNPLAEMTLRMVDAGFLRATSVGFIPLSGKPAKGRGPNAYDFDRQELLEISIVPVGSLPDALLAARSAGIDITPAREWAKRILEIDMAEPAPKTVIKRDLYDVGWLAQLLQSLAYLEECVEYESEQEGDDSPVVGMLADAIKQLGATLIAMTTEEVAELLGEEIAEEREADTAGQRAMKAMGRALRNPPVISAPVTIDTAPLVAEIRSALDGIAKIHAGRVLSSSNEKCLREVHDHIAAAAESVRGVLDQLPSEGDDTADGGDGDQFEESRAAADLRARKAKALSYTRD